LTDYWKKYDETEKYLHPSECENKKQLREHILDEFFAGNEKKYGQSADKLSNGLWQYKPYKEGIKHFEGVISIIHFKQRNKQTGEIMIKERHVVRDEKSGRFKKWL